MIHRVVSGGVVALLLTAVACQPPPPQPTAKPFFRMNDAAGSTVARDSNNVSHGQASNVTFGQPGLQGTSAGFNGTTSIIRVPHHASMNPGNADFSISAAVNFTELPGESTWDVVRKGTDADGSYWKLEVLDGGLDAEGAPRGARARCSWKDTAGVSFSRVLGRQLNDGTWHTIVCSIVGNEHRITVDGVTSAKTPATPLGNIANTREATIGASPDLSDAYVGSIDIVRFG
jgi:hypothetical protein